MEELRSIFNVLSLLFLYPEQWIDNDILSEIAQIEDEELRMELNKFYDTMAQQNRAHVLEEYIGTFDFNEKTTLYLTYSFFKEKRERGEILAHLKGIYTEAGYSMVEEEIPDYLPLVFEFFSIAPKHLIEKVFNELKPALKSLTEELQTLKSPYADLMTCFFKAMEGIKQ